MNITLEQLKEFKEEVKENKQKGNKVIPPNADIKLYDYHIQESGLNGIDLLLYAIIYGFTVGTQDGMFKGSANYLASRLNVSIPYVLRCLHCLTGIEYLEKIIINEHPCYRVPAIDIPQKMDGKYILIKHSSIEMGLKGNKLLIYSYIDSLTKNCEYFWYTHEFIANKLNITRQTVGKCLKSLEKDGLIMKSDMLTLSNNDWSKRPVYVTT